MRWLSMQSLWLFAWRDRVYTPSVPWVTFSQTEHGQVETFPCTVGVNCFLGIGRAGRIETALAAEPWAQQQTVATNQEEKEGLHNYRAFIQCRCNDARRATGSAAPAFGCAMTTRSSPSSVLCVRRKLSRIQRLIRLRTTALVDTRRETVKPRRACPRLLARVCTLNRLSRIRRPVRLISRSSRPDRKRRLFDNPSRDGDGKLRH
jgi:hypothetical protein